MQDSETLDEKKAVYDAEAMIVERQKEEIMAFMQHSFVPTSQNQIIAHALQACSRELKNAKDEFESIPFLDENWKSQLAPLLEQIKNKRAQQGMIFEKLKGEK